MAKFYDVVETPSGTSTFTPIYFGSEGGRVVSFSTDDVTIRIQTRAGGERYRNVNLTGDDAVVWDNDLDNWDSYVAPVANLCVPPYSRILLRGTSSAADGWISVENSDIQL